MALGGYHSAMYDRGVYHLWYTAGGCTLYARSRDGIHWEKPNLNLGKADQASGTQPPPNLVLGRGVGGVKEGMHGLMVFVDPKAGDDERFKLVANPKEFDSQLQVFSSPDGLHWRHAYTNVITYNSAVKPHHLDSQNVIFWDDRIQKYVAYFRKNVREPGSQGRMVARAESPDLTHFGRAEDCPVVMQADPQHVVQSDSPKKERIALLGYLHQRISQVSMGGGCLPHVSDRVLPLRLADCRVSQGSAGQCRRAGYLFRQQP